MFRMRRRSRRRWPTTIIKRGDAFYRVVCTQKLLGRDAHSRKTQETQIREEDARHASRDVTGSDNAPPRIACTRTHNAERLNASTFTNDDQRDPTVSTCASRPPRASFLPRSGGE